MLNSGRRVGVENQSEPGAAHGHRAQQVKALHSPKQLRLRERPGQHSPGKLSSGLRSNDRPSPGGDDKAGRSGQDEWTSRDAYDYALKRASGYVADEDRVAVAIFYSLFPDASSCYAALDETGKERMRWCARAAIAALSEKRPPAR